MNKTQKILSCILSIILLGLIGNVYADSHIELIRLRDAYPETIHVSPLYIAWRDGTHMRVHGSYPLLDKLESLLVQIDQKNTISINGLRCDRYEPFFKKMYGSTPSEVKKKLVIVYWMPHVFGKRYPLKITTVNGVNKKIERISAALEKLPRSYYKYVENPAGSFYWRNVKHEKYLSAHSFGIAIDINSHYGNYWMWDWEKAHRPAKRPIMHNRIPMEIVHLFEQEGFLWGGRWDYYDTMHFEYRPELFVRGLDSKLYYNNQLGLRCYA